MVTYSLALSLFDFVPVIAFLIGAMYLVRWARLFDRRVVSLSMLLGSILAVLGGATKATWKFLVTINVGDFIWLGEAQFALLAPGFLLMLVSTWLIFSGDKKEAVVTLEAMAAWKIPFLAVMTISSLWLYALLAILGWRERNYMIVIMYVIIIVTTIGLAGMATMEQTIAQQWIEEGVNSMGQIAFAVGSMLLFQDYKPMNSE